MRVDHGVKIAEGTPGQVQTDAASWRPISAMPPLLSVEGLSSGYGPAAVLHDVSLSVQARERVAVLGANGAGKTTLVGACFTRGASPR